MGFNLVALTQDGQSKCVNVRDNSTLSWRGDNDLSPIRKPLVPKQQKHLHRDKIKNWTTAALRQMPPLSEEGGVVLFVFKQL